MNHTTPGPFVVSAKVVGDTPIETVEVRVDDGDCVWKAVVAGAGAKKGVLDTRHGPKRCGRKR